MNAKKTSSNKVVTITTDGDVQRTLAKASRALSELAAASITIADNGRGTKRS